MPINNSNNAPREQALKINPCGICRAAGLPTCKGHGGGSGGSGGSDLASDDASTTAASKDSPSLSPTIKPSELLIQSELWAQPNSWESIFTFNSLNALIDLRLDLERGLLSLSSNKGLATDQQKAVDELFDAIKNEFNQFKTELANKGVSVEQMQLNHQGNNLTLMLPTPKYYDAFIQRLMNKNLLATEAPSPKNGKRDEYIPISEKSISEAIAPEPTDLSTTSTPFDMTPKPKG
jgi:hypothetical protein